MSQNVATTGEQTSRLEQELAALPEVTRGRNLWQNEMHEYDVYDHTMAYAHVMKTLSEDPNMIAAAYLHDVGKPVTAKPKTEGVREKAEGMPYHHFHGHELEGAKIVRRMAPALFRTHGLVQEKVAALVEHHYAPMKGIKAMRKEATWEGFYECYRRLDDELQHLSGGVRKAEVLMMFLADKLGQGKSVPDIDELRLLHEAMTVQDDSRRRHLLERVFDLQRHYPKKP